MYYYSVRTQIPLLFSQKALGGRTTARIPSIGRVPSRDVPFLTAAVLTACFLLLIKVSREVMPQTKGGSAIWEKLADKLDRNQGMIRSLPVSGSGCHQSKLNIMFSLERIPDLTHFCLASSRIAVQETPLAHCNGF